MVSTLAPTRPARSFKYLQAAEKGPDARRRPKAAREAYSLYVERAAEGANEADGPFSAACRLVEAPGEDVDRRHLDDDRVRLVERSLAAILRVLPVQERADLLEPRPLRVELRQALYRGALDVRPVVRVQIDRHRDSRVLFEVQRLVAVARRGEVDLPVDHHLTHRNQLRHPVRVRHGHTPASPTG